MRSARLLLAWASLLGAGCVPELERPPRDPVTTVPDSYGGSKEETAPSSGQASFRELFRDPRLLALIDLALERNQELNIALLEVDLAQFEVLEKEGEYLPKVRLVAGAGLEKVGEDTSQGRSDEATDVPEHLPDLLMGLSATWEIDIWRKLRNASDAATQRWLSTIEGRKFLVTALVAEVAESYYELLALDNQLAVLSENIGLQQQALEVVRLQKEAGRVTELAVKRFEAEVLKNQSGLYAIQQRITETENRLNFLAGRFPQRIERDSAGFLANAPPALHGGVPTQLLENRTDVKQAELRLEAAKLDVEVARAGFYPSLEIDAGVLYQSFKAASIVDTPASLAYLVAAELSQPLWNRKELTARWFSANSRQMQAVHEYERTILRSFNEVANQLAMVENLASSYEARAREVERLDESIAISTELFTSARAEYMEVLLTRRDALEARMELIETREQQLGAVVRLYRALGGGWR